MNWKWLPGKNYYAITTFGYQDLYANSINHFIQSITPDNLDKRLGKILILTQNHLWNVGSKHSVEFGFEFKKFQTYYGFNEIRYDLYNSTIDNIIIDSVHVDSKAKGYTFSAFIEDTWTIFKFLKILPGVRVSKQNYSIGWYIAPRLAANAEIVKNLNLRAAWGIYYQPDNFEKLKSFEGQSTPLPNNNECVQYMTSLDYKLKNVDLKVDAYYKDYKHLTDDFRYDVYNRIPFIIDKNFNTQRGKSKGLEFTFRYKFGKDNILSFCYAYAKNTIFNNLNQETYRNFDRRHSFTINSILNLPKNWSISFLYMFYTGEPYTPFDIAFIGMDDNNQGMFFYKMGIKNSARLPNFHTVDFRFSKTWNFKRFHMNTYLNIINLFDRQNITGFNWYAWQNSSERWYVSKYENSLNIPRFISPGISVTF
jgi:ferric enterobactin receptor